MPEQTCNDKRISQAGVNKVAARKFRAVLADVRGHGLELMVTQVLRPVSVQRKLYCAGRSDTYLRAAGLSYEEISAARKAGYLAKDDVLTGTLNSMHCKGLAMDVVPLVNGVVTWDAACTTWVVYGSAVKAHGLTWGGAWRSLRDLPHCEWRG